MKLFARAIAAIAAFRGAPATPPAAAATGNPVATDVYFQRLYQQNLPSFAAAAVIREVRQMDKSDGRVKFMHGKIARDATRGGFTFHLREAADDPRLQKEAASFIKRCGLDKRRKLKAHARALNLDGELFLEWILDGKTVIGVKRLPPESMMPNVDELGRFRDPAKAYRQHDPATMVVKAEFARYQITHIRLDANEDDPGARGRPLLDAARQTYRKLSMTEDDLVLRRRARAPRRLLHVIHGADEDELKAYKKRNEDSADHPLDVTSDFFTNKEGTIQPIEGDANLDQVADVKMLKDDFYAGAGLAPHLFGFVGDVNRDIFADSLEGFYEILEELQEVLADGYEEGFRLQLLLLGIDADAFGWDFKFTGRKVESPNQLSDRLIKHSTLGIPPEMIWSQLGYNPDQVRAARAAAAAEEDPYAARLDAELNGGQPAVKIVQGNARNGESAAYVKTGSK